MDRFSPQFEVCIRRDRLRLADKWHMDEVVIPINGVKQWLCRAIDANGNAIDILIQPHHNAKAAKRFFAGLVTASGKPPVVITDKQRSYTKPIQANASGADH